MAISVADNFSYKGSKPLDARIQYSTVANMKNATTSDLYDGCLAYVTATKKNYQYDSTNSVDPTTGKWRELQTGGGGGSSTFADLDDVDFDNLQNGQVPKWNSVTEKWENGNAGGSGGGHVIEDEGVALTQRDTLNFVDFDLEDDDTNEKTVVQSHELTQEEFEEIFSSGLPGAITGFDLSNTTCEANIHSTDERVIGQWIDGKPLYQKTITFNTLTAGANNFIPHNIQNVDTIYPIDGSVKLSGGAYLPIPRLASDANKYDMWSLSITDFDTTQFLIHLGTAYTGTSATITSGCVTLRYTKTTDSAVASGEKIVGQWIDGKPIFEKVVTFATEKQTTAGTLLTIPSSETGLANIDTAIYIQALNYASGVVGQVIPARYNLSPAGELKVNTYENAYIKYLVLRYTKS